MRSTLLVTHRLSLATRLRLNHTINNYRDTRRLPVISISTRLSSSAPLTQASSSVPSTTTPTEDYLPVDFQTSAKIEGEESHVVMINLNPGECVRAESGSMVFMTDGIQMNTKLAGASNAFRRMMTGQNLFLTDFTSDKPATLCLGTDFPSKILRINLQDLPNETLICQRGAYLASNPTIDIEMEFTKSLKAGFFGGQGFVLQKLTGVGDVLIKGGGAIVKKTLEQGQSLRVTSSSIVAFESNVEYDVTMMPGIKNAMFGGEGLFVTTLKNNSEFPGRVWLQGLPPDRMISEIARRVPGPGIGLGIPIMGGGGSSVGEEGVEGEGDGTADAGVSESVAATDAAVEADRQATVASSGMMGDNEQDVDPDSPSSLFGDAAPETPDTTSTATTSEELFPGETTFSDDGSFSADSQPSMDETSFSTDEFESDFKEEDFLNDTTTTDVGSEEAGEQGSSLLGTLWDLFTGGDD